MLKLPKLPDRTTTKISFNATVKLKEELQAYTALYRDTYGGTSSATELIPFMLEVFLKSDPAFAKAQKKVADIEEQASRASLLRTRKNAAAPNFHPTEHMKEA